MSEFVVLEGSLLEGMRLEDLVRKYNINVLHYHSPNIDTQTRHPFNPKIVIEPYFLVKVSGFDKAVKKLRLDSVTYINKIKNSN